MVRNVRSESLVNVALALQHEGAEALVEELLQDRVARSGVAPAASLLNTWRAFHDLTFNQASPPIPMIPVTVRSLVLTGALFKRGGYRSYSNYLSAIKAVHVEAGYEWTQLLAHTGAWVTRSVVRGIEPARQSCSFAFHKLCTLP